MQYFKREFSVYFVVGGIATLIDWGVYALFLWLLGSSRYLLPIIFSIGLAGTFHYLANKRLTFQCQSKAVKAQVPIYVFVAIIGLLLSMLILHFLVAAVVIPPLFGRILTTIIMLLPNYFMHKYLTFNKKIFGKA